MAVSLVMVILVCGRALSAKGPAAHPAASKQSKIAAVVKVVSKTSDGPGDKEKAEAGAAKQAKMAAVDKVISMLEDLQKQVMSEGEVEAETYNKFACFCKDMTGEKGEAVEKGGDEKEKLTASIGDQQAKRDELDSTIETLQKDIDAAEKEMKKAEEERAKQLKTYEANEADLVGAIEALEGAIDALKASKGGGKTPSFAQLRTIGKTVRTAAALADALSLSDVGMQRALASFMQQSDAEVPTEDYEFHSDSVIETLEKLLVKFRDEKGEVDAAEEKAVAAHEAFMQEKTAFVERKTTELEDTRKEKGRVQSEIATLSSDLSTVAAVLLDDQAYLAGLADMCSKKAKTWDQRSGVRADELSAITAAVTILKETVSEKVSGATIRFTQQGVNVRLAEAVAQNEADMEAVEADAEASEGDAPAFLQRSLDRPRRLLSAIAERRRALSGNDDGRQAVAALLRLKGKELGSKELSTLAATIAADPFAKVKTLIQELIERLLAQASSETTQKGWCDKSLAAASQKRDHSAGAIEEINSGMAPLEALRDKLGEELEVLAEEIAGLEDEKAKAEKVRAEEKAENAKTVSVATEGLKAVEEAIDILAKFYATAKKGKVDLAALQAPVDDDAPDAGFESGEAYGGSQGAAGGVLGMLDVIRSDFQRTVTETEKAEKEAEEDHLKFMTDTGKSLAEKQTATEQKTHQKDDAEEKLTSFGEDLASQTALLQKSIEELLELQPVCVDTGMSYEERVALREEEIEALKKASCVLENYQKYGDDAAAKC